MGRRSYKEGRVNAVTYGQKVGRGYAGAKICSVCGELEDTNSLYEGGDPDLWIIRAGREYVHRKCK